MTKKALALCLVFFMILSFAACIRFEATVKINANGTADVHMLLAASDALASLGDGQPIGLSEEEIAEYKAKGFTYEEYIDVDAGYTGYVLSQKGVDLKMQKDQSTETGMESILDGELFTVDGKHITLDFTPFTENDYEESGSYFSILKNYGGYMKFNLELPVKPTKHNATSVSEDGKTLTWDLTKLGPNDTVHAEFDMPSSILTWLLPIIAMLVIAIVAAAVILKKRKQSAIVEPNALTEQNTVVQQSEE